MLKKVLVANRGEIAIRAFRAATELGIRTVAVYTPDDRDSLHRQQADEAYEIGEVGHPVRAYLEVETLVRMALDIGAEAVYPGYGFLSESAELARACEEAGLTFVGSSSQVLSLTGDKLEGRRRGRGQRDAPRAARGGPLQGGGGSDARGRERVR